METPGQAMDTELGWPGPLHLVTVGMGVGPARSPQPQPGPKGARGVPMPWGAAPQGGHGVVRAVVARAELESTQLFSSWSLPPHSSLLVFLILTSSSSSSPLHAILVSLLLSSSQISLSSSFGLPPASLAFSSSRPSHPSHHLLDLPLFSASCHHLLSHFLFSCHLLSTAEMARGHAVCHHNPYFRARGITLPSPAPSWPQHCPQLVLMSPGWDRAVSPAQATVAPTPVALHVLPSQ